MTTPNPAEPKYSDAEIESAFERLEICDHFMTGLEKQALDTLRRCFASGQSTPYKADETEDGHRIRVLSHDGEWEGEARWEHQENAYVTQDAVLTTAQPAERVVEELTFTDATIDKFQDVMATHGFAVPVRVISDAFRTAQYALTAAKQADR